MNKGGSAPRTRAIAESTQASDWPRWRGPQGDGVAADANWDWHKLSDGPKILWKVNVGFGVSNVALQGGRLYTMEFGGFKSPQI